MLTSVDVNVLPQSIILLQVLQEVLVLSEGRQASQLGSWTLMQRAGGGSSEMMCNWFSISLPLVIRVHAFSVSGHLLQLPVPALHPPGAVVTLLNQNLQQIYICVSKRGNVIFFPEQFRLPLEVSVGRGWWFLKLLSDSPHQEHGEGSSCSGSRHWCWSWQSQTCGATQCYCGDHPAGRDIISSGLMLTPAPGLRCWAGGPGMCGSDTADSCPSLMSSEPTPQPGCAGDQQRNTSGKTCVSHLLNDSNTPLGFCLWWIFKL